MSKNYIIPKGFHYSNFIPWFKCIKGSFEIERTIVFTDSCGYEIDEPSCVNKLFGFCFGMFGVHKNSARFGWTYDKGHGVIKLWKYVYEGGKLEKEVIEDVQIGEPITLKLYVEQIKPVNITKWRFDKDTNDIVETDNSIHTNYCVNFVVNNHTICYWYIPTDIKYIVTLGPYFGGKTKAPHCIRIIENNKKIKMYNKGAIGL